MKRKTYLTIIWSITLCVILFSSTQCTIKSKNFFSDFWKNFVIDFDDSDNQDWENNLSPFDSDKWDSVTSNSTQVRLSEFSQIVVDANIMTLTIEEGNSWNLRCDFSHKELQPDYKMNNNTLTVRQHLSSKPKVASKKCDLVITVPKNTSLEDVDVKINVGEIEISSVDINKLAVNLNIGEIDIDKVQFDTFTGKTNIGELSIDNLHNLEDYEVFAEVNLGDIKIENDHFGRKYRQKISSEKKIDCSVNIGEISIN